MGANVMFEPVNQISRARNTGAEKAEGDWFLFIDADTYPSLELIEEVVDLIEEDKHIGCGSTIRVEGGTLFNKLRLERMNPIFRLLNLCGGAFLLCCRKGFESINGFSNNLYAYEEVDFVIRLKKYGRTLEKGFKILHHHPVVTSGRKGEYRFFQMLTLFVSNFMAVFIFALHYILPEQYIRKLGSRWLRYWYNNRR
jgi:GT2 family glycosyltransferase